MGQSEPLNELIRLLGDEDPEIRLEGVRRLRSMPDKVAVAGLLRLVEDGEWRVRKAAVDALVERDGAGALEGLIAILGLQENAGARNSAIEALTRLGAKATSSLVDGFRKGGRDERKFIIDILGEIKDPSSIPLMLAALNDEDENVKASAIEHLGNMGESSVVDRLIEVLDSGDFWMAYPAADALGRIGDSRAVPALISVLDRKALREPAVRALGLIGDETAVSHITVLLRDGSKVVQEEALRALVELLKKGVPEEAIRDALREVFGEAAPANLLPFARESKAGVRKAGILLLGVLRDETTIRPLMDLVQEEDLSAEVMRVLEGIAAGNPSALMPFLDEEMPVHRRTAVTVAAGSKHPAFADSLKQRLRDEDGHVRATAALGLADLRVTDAVEEIAGLLEDRYEDVQENAVRALALYGDELPTERIFSGLESDSPSLRRNCAMLLGLRGQGGREVISSLEFALKDDNISVRTAVVDALALIGGAETDRVLIRALTDEVADIRRAAALALGNREGAEITEAISLLCRDQDDWVRAAAATALGRVGEGEGASALVKLLDDESGLVRATAAEALGGLPGPASVKALLAHLGDPDAEMRRTIVESLGRIGGAKEGALLGQFLEDPDWSVRKAAVDGIAALDLSLAMDVVSGRIDQETDEIVLESMRRVLRDRS